MVLFIYFFIIIYFVSLVFVVNVFDCSTVFILLFFQNQVRLMSDGEERHATLMELILFIKVRSKITVEKTTRIGFT